MLRKPACLIFGAGRPPDKRPEVGAGDLVIAADGGYYYTQAAGIKVDALIGDFDSLAPPPDLETSGMFVLRLPKEKDQTDMMAALQYGLQNGFTSFHIYGGTGGRIDHTLANVQSLGSLLDHGSRGYLYDGETVITVMRGELRLDALSSGMISVFAFGGAAEGVYLQGLKYELVSARLATSYPIGVSNEFIGAPAYIKAETGDLLLVYPSCTLEVG